MKFRCTQCGSEEVQIVSDGTLSIHHEVDLRHYPAEMTDAQLTRFKEEALENVEAVVDHHITAHRKQRDARAKGKP